ncbi:MAG TPA: heparinase II/III family protein [Rhizomicrobium sp.]|jgi:uncharacterized heparinase superfamily protein
MRLALLPELIGAMLRQAVKPVLAVLRRSWPYRRLLKGKMPDRIVFQPFDAASRRLEDADALLKGRFRFAGEALDVKEGSVFDKAPLSRAWAEGLHGFTWLAALSAAGGEAARVLATNLIAQWLKRNARYSEPAWAPEVTAQRLINLFAHGRFVLANSDVLWRSKLYVSLREQSRLLARSAPEAPDGLPRFEAAAAHALSGACLNDSPKRLASGLEQLEREIARQLLPDGGHAGRSPETLFHAYRHVVMVMDALAAIDQPVPAALRSAHDRMAPMLRFFRLGDGTLALFNGGGEGDAKMIEALLARDEVRGQPFGFAPHSAFHRLAAGRSLVVMDCGRPPDGAFSTEAHAGCLSFEMSAGAQRLIVNCGASRQLKWANALRATAAHSTVALADTSTSTILQPGLARSLLGPRLLDGVTTTQTARRETSNGWTVEASHDGYLAPFGILHQRRLTLSPNGTALTGGDWLTPRAGGKRPRGGIPFAARFHVHPEVRISPSQGGGALLKLPSGEGWRFQAAGGALSIEESVYLGGETARRTEQLVIGGAIKDDMVELGWLLEQINP